MSDDDEVGEERFEKLGHLFDLDLDSSEVGEEEVAD